MAEFADQRGTEEVRAELVEEKKVASRLRPRIKEMIVAHEGFEKYQTDLQTKLDEARRERKEALEKARIT